MYPKLHRRSFSQSDRCPFIASWLIGSSSVTERASDHQHLGSLDDAICGV